MMNSSTSRKRGRPAKNKTQFIEEELPLFDSGDFDEENDNDLTKTESFTESDTSPVAFYQKIGRTRVLKKEEEISLFKRYLSGDKKAQKEIIDYNMRLVCSISRKYCNKGVDFEDLVQEGVFGLIKAIDKFDYNRGFKFSTYATFWIQQAIRQAINKSGRIIRLPAHIIEKYQAIGKIRQEHLEKYDEEISLEELSKKLNLSIKRIQDIERALQHTYSLDFVMSNSDGNKDDSVVNYYVHDEKPHFETKIAEESQHELLMKKISLILTKDEEIVVKNKYGIELDFDFDQWADSKQLTKERIKQIEKDSMKKLKKELLPLKLTKELSLGDEV